MCVILTFFADNNTLKEIHAFVVYNEVKYGFKSFLQMTGEIPNGDSYEGIMGTLNSDDLNQILFDFFKAITFELNPKIEIASFDGKVNNGSKRNSTMLNEAKKPLNCLNVYYNKFGYCGSTIKIDEKK